MAESSPKEEGIRRPRQPINVLVYGLPGSGKSSVIDLMEEANIDASVAETFTYHEVQRGKLMRTLATPSFKRNNSNVIILIVLRKERITSRLEMLQSDLQKLQKSSLRRMCLLVVTGCDYKSDDNWWKENQYEFEKYNISFPNVVTGCSLPISGLLNNKELHEHIDERRMTTRDIISNMMRELLAERRRELDEIIRQKQMQVVVRRPAKKIPCKIL